MRKSSEFYLTKKGTLHEIIRAECLFSCDTEVLFNLLEFNILWFAGRLL